MSRHVSIDKEALVRFATKLHEEGIQIPRWSNRYHLTSGTEEMVSYILVLDSINFCFWPEQGKEKWEIEYGSEKLSGYYALAAVLKKAVVSGIPITKAYWLAEMTLDELKKILGGRGELQLLEDRLMALKELGQVLLDEYDGKALHLVEASQGSAVNLSLLLAEKLSSFRDVAEYSCFKVSFLKRAQIFASDLFGAFGGKGSGNLNEIDRLSCFADYKLPQVLRHLGIMQYSQTLAQKIDQRILIEAQSAEEVEIRANTVWSVELLRRELQAMGEDVRAFEIDWILWNMGQSTVCCEKPYHRTLTVYY
ncbi:MAG: queuosine salvage family protein [Thermodesulfobacteriota bacterium]|nr:queuosine salvage family protein [Thermodesulfobacteriota bacterium]